MADNKQRPQAPKVEKYSQSTNKTTTVQQTAPQKTMLEKTQAQTTSTNETGWARILALGVLIFGLVVLLAILILVIVTRISPRIDASLAIPVLKDLPGVTNAAKVTVSGTTVNESQAIIFVDDNQTATVDVDKDGNFSYEYTFGAEKKYKFEAAGLTGSIVKVRSNKSAPVETTYDKTAPSGVVTFKYNGTSTKDTVTISGTADANTTVTLKNGDKSYTGTTDSAGNVTIKDIKLNAGKNDFTVTVTDPAGNSTTSSTVVSITYSKSSSNGGTGSTGGSKELPNSAGLFDDAMSAIGQNNFMFAFGLFALGLLVVNGTIVAVKLKKQNKY